WSSLDTEIATVDQTGLVTAVAEGATSIVATTEDGGFTDSCALTVTAAAVSNVNDPLTKTYTGSVEVSGMGSVYVITALATNYTAYMKIGSEVINSTYTVADNVVTIDTGNANYGVFVGSLSADRNTLTKTSMSGAYSAAVGSLVMNAAMVLEDANGTSTAALQSKYLTQYDTGNGAWTASNSADRIEYDTVNKLEGDGAMKMKNGTFGKMRYKSASMPASLGNFVTFGMWFYNDTGASISAQMFLYSAGGSPFITLVNSLTIPSNSTWTYYTVGFTSYAVAGWSIILPSASATGHPVLDYVTLA
ncbi:MAG: Ig-like domain-containing protein, partial [Bacilli bacterium]|nr:Ig-like domain-containing protein [Bacilli bacterium]